MKMILSLGLISLLGINLSFQDPKMTAEMLPTLYLPKSIKHFTFGFSESLADSLWLRVIQDIDFCETRDDNEMVENVSSEAGNNDGKEYSLEEKVVNLKMDFFDALEQEKQSRPRCDLGWVYRMIDGITELSPRFKVAYRVGGSMLSVIVDDREGAAKIFEKGLVVFPEDWTIAYRAAYHALYELRDYKRSAQLLRQAGEHGAPDWVLNLATKLYKRIGQLEFGRVVLVDMLKKAKGKPRLEREVLKKLKALDAAIAAEARKEKKVK